MKHLPLLYCFLFLHCASDKNKSLNNDWHRLNLNGMVSSVIQNTYLAKDSAGIIIASSKKVSVVIHDFNENGFLKRMETNTLAPDQHSHYQNQYDEYGNKTKSIRIDRPSTSLLFHAYDNDHNLETTYRVTSKQDTLKTKRFIYDNQDRISEQFTFAPNGKGDYISKVIFEYDEGFAPILLTTVASDGTLINKEIRENNETGRILKQEFYNSNNKIMKTLFFKYDEYDNVVYHYQLHQTGKKYEEKSYFYEYDERNNWVKRIIEFPNSTYRVEKRVIEYSGR